MRSISRIVDALDTGKIWRAIGTTDFLGQGTTHEVGDVNPFVLLDHAHPFEKKGMPPFGLHPHSGLHVTSLLWDGPVSSRLGFEEEATVFGESTPTAVGLMAGRGCSHDEHSATDARTEMSQVAWLVPETSRSKVARVEELLLRGWRQLEEGVEVLVAVGTAFSMTSNITPETPLTLLMLRVADKSEVKLDSLSGGTFVYVVEGDITIGDRKAHAGQLVVFEDGSTDAVHIKATSNARLVYGSGERIQEPWAKLLTHNGFLLAQSQENALAQEELIKQHGVASYGQH